MSGLKGNATEINEVGGTKFRFGYINALGGGAGIGDEHDDSYFRRTARRENVLSGAGNVYHYTSLAGFQGIISEFGFWASDNRFMNDFCGDEPRR